MSQLQNFPRRKIALSTSLALAAARLLSQVCPSRRQPNPPVGSGKGSSKSSIFRAREILQLAQMKKILIIKTSAIGDVLQTFPVVEALQARFPGAQIDWLVEKGCSSLLKAHPGLNRVIEIDTKSWRSALLKRNTWRELAAVCAELRQTHYDAVFDLQGNTKSALFTLLAKAQEKVGYSRHCVPEWPNLLATNRKKRVDLNQNVRSAYLQLVDCHADDNPVLLQLTEDEKARLETILASKARVMVAFGSKWPHKMLSEQTLQQWLAKINVPFLFIYGNNSEKEGAERLSAQFPGSGAVGELTLPLWQALMAQMDYVIAMDSAALHLCGTTNTPSFSVFGPSMASAYKPLGRQHGHFQGSCPYQRTFAKRCPILRTCETGACMKDISADELYIAFTSWQAQRN